MKIKHWLILILALAAVLRLYGLSRGDTVNDEVFYGFRAVGLMDFDEAADQTTPWEWTDPEIPGWMRMSFHDHPPLVFWIQHFDSRFWRKQFRAAVSVGDFGSFIRLYFISDRRENFFGARRASWSIFNGRDA